MNILYVEDDARDADLTRREFARSAPHFRLDTVATQQEALARLAGEPNYDLVLTDLRLPDGDGLALLAHVRERALPLAVVVITGGGDEEMAVAALKAGADDYVVKGGDYLARLPLALENALHRFRAEADRRARPLRALYAEHNANDVDLTRRHLARHAPHIHLDVVHSATEVFQRLSEKDRYDLLLLDYQLPGMNGLEVLKELDQVHRLDLPVVLVTGRGDEEVAVQALKLGAADYLVKSPGYLYRLPSVLENAFHRVQLAREQAALRESQAQFQDLYENAPNAYFSVGVDGLIHRCNRHAGELLGYAVEELVGRPVFELYTDTPQGKEKASQVFERFQAGETVTDEEMQMQKADGTPVWTSLTVNAVRDAQGRVVESRSIVVDITERKRAEEALRKSAERYRSLFEGLPVGLYRMTPQGLILHANPALVQMLGYPDRRALMAVNALDLYVDAEDLERQQALLEREGLARDFETQFRRYDGTVIWVRNTVRAVRSDSRDVFYHEGSLEDITERKRAEEALRKRTEEVELLYEAGQQLSQTLDIDTIYDRLHGLVSGIMDCDSLAVSSFDPEDKLICCAFAIIEGNQQDVSHLPPLPLNPEGQGTQSLVIHTGRSLLIRDYQGRVKTSKKAYYVDEEGEFVDHDKAPDDADVTRSGLIVPVKLEGQVVGIIQVLSYRLDAYTEDDLRILESLAHQIAVASNNALLYQQAQDEIVQRKRAEEERARLLAQVHGQAQQVQQIIDTMPEGVLLLDADGRVILANPVAEGDLAVLADVSVDDTLRPGSGQALRPGSGQALTRLGDRSLAELLTSPPKGLWHEVATDSRRFEVIARPLESGPEPEGWVLVIRDVTREREIQQRAQQRERLATVGQLAAGIAHDFNNIMATIVLYAQMLSQTEDLTPRGHERLATVNQQAMYATNLTQQILDFSRRAVLERRPLNLLPLLKEQIKLLERTLPENIEIALAYGPDEYTVNADPTRMQQAMMNLALNARDAMPEGGNLRIGLERIQVQPGESPPLPEMKAGEWVQVTVADTGSGIPPDILPHVFDPFFTTKEPGAGSGLGLAQVHGIVKQHEGEIDVQTQVGQGTTFTIYLPALPVHPAEAPTLEMEALTKGEWETILVVEDNAPTRQALVESLELLNYRTLEAADGQEALEALERQTSEVSSPEIVLVLSDVVMPEMGGVALFHALRQKGLMVKVVLMTGHPLEKEMESLRTQGLSDWLPKPPSLEQLAEVVARALES